MRRSEFSDFIIFVRSVSFGCDSLDRDSRVVRCLLSKPQTIVSILPSPGRLLSSTLMAFTMSVSLASQTLAQVPRTLTLTAPLSEHPEPLTQPTALLELRDGRVLVADTKDRLLYLYDFAAGTATQVSRQGSGPLEYQLPAGLFASGDSIMVLDMLQQRLLVLDAKGAPRGTHRLVPTGDATSAILKLGQVFAIDAKGRFYSESRGITIVQGKMPTMSDTVALVRWTSLGGRGDT